MKINEEPQGRMHSPRCYTKENDGQLNHLISSPKRTVNLHLDALRHTALGCLAMAWLIRKSAALVAVYSIALQAVLWGFVPAGHFGFDPFAIICTADSAGDHAPSLPQHRSDCDACLAACGSSPALVPASVAFSLIPFPDGPKRLTSPVEAPSLQPRHQPQESRAPPIQS